MHKEQISKNSKSWIGEDEREAPKHRQALSSISASKNKILTKLLNHNVFIFLHIFYVSIYFILKWL